MNYYSAVTTDFAKIDIGIFEEAEFSSKAILNGFTVVKGDGDFKAACKRLANRSVAARCKPPQRDVNLNNIALLLFNGATRAKRGEYVSASSYVQMAIDMTISLQSEKICNHLLFDPHDPRRHLEAIAPDLGDSVNEILSQRADKGVQSAGRLVAQIFQLSEAQQMLLERTDKMIDEA